MTIGERLIEVRKSAGLNQTEFSKRLGLSKQTISNYETGARQPGLDVILNIADIFNISTDYLLGRSDIKNIDKKSLEEILSQKIETSNESIRQIMPLFNQFLNILKLSNSNNTIKELESFIEWLYNHICQSLEDTDLEQRYVAAVSAKNEKLVESYETLIKQNIQKGHYFIRLNKSLNSYIDALRKNYREKLIIKLFKEQ